MIDVSELMDDPDFAASYTIWRKSGKWVNGRFETNEVPLQFYGPVQPPQDNELEQIPEGDRLKEYMNFSSTQPIYLTDNKGVSDEAEYRGRRYKIIRVKDWGTWYRALGVRI